MTGESWEDQTMRGNRLLTDCQQGAEKRGTFSASEMQEVAAMAAQLERDCGKTDNMGLTMSCTQLCERLESFVSRCVESTPQQEKPSDERIARWLDAMETGATATQRYATWDDLRAFFYPLEHP